jgi:hypothetical protein
MNSLIRLRTTLALTALGALAAQGTLACNAPRTPTPIPDGRKAQMTVMLESKRNVEAYLRDVSSYMNCENDALKLQEAKARQTEVLNWFNAEARAFKVVNRPVMAASSR